MASKAPSSYLSWGSRNSRRVQYEVREWAWPVTQLMIWRFVMYGTAGTLIGVFAIFVQIQQQLRIATPWLFSYGITVGSLTILFLFFGEAALLKGRLLPAYVMLYSFVAFVLYLTGFIETAIQLFGQPGNVNGACNNQISGNPSFGVSIDTLAWLAQRSICQSWNAVFAFWLVGSVLFVWLFVLAIVVNRTKKTHGACDGVQ